jgi:hypothetical protein
MQLWEAGLCIAYTLLFDLVCKLLAIIQLLYMMCRFQSALDQRADAVGSQLMNILPLRQTLQGGSSNG